MIASLTDHYLSQIDDDLTSVIDLDLLKFQLTHQRKKLSSLMDSIMKTELSYEHVVPRVDYEHLSGEQTQLEKESDLLKEEYQHLGQACLYLINRTHDLIDERNRYYQDWQQHRSMLTPRPDWDKVSNVIDGGADRWRVLSTGRSSDELVEIVVREIVDGNQTSVHEDDYFQGNGEGEGVLTFLQTPKNTSIINRRMRRRLTGLLIKEIWTEKIRKPSDNPIPDFTHTTDENLTHHDRPRTLADHVASYFEQRFHSRAIAIEMGYNLRDACLRYRHAEQINLFWGIITGQIEELVYHHQMTSIAQLLQHLIRMTTIFSLQDDSLSPEARKAIVSEPNSPPNNQRLSLLSMFSSKAIQESLGQPRDLLMTDEQLMESLTTFYPRKTVDQINELYMAAKRDLYSSGEAVSLSLLFIEDDEGRYSEFLSTLIKQICQEKASYVDQIKQILVGYPLITVPQFSRAVHMIDPKIDRDELHRYIEWVFMVKNYEPAQQIKPLDLEDLLRRLENCACFQH